MHLLFRDHDNRKEKATTTAVTTAAANASWLRGAEAKYRKTKETGKVFLAPCV